MVGKNVRKTKLQSKPVKTVQSKRRKKLHRNVSPQPFSPNSTSHDYTLPDGNYYDSFDKLRLSIRDEERCLKKINLVKKDVQASFNRDSSIEIESDDLCLTNSISSVMLIHDSVNEESKLEQIDLRDLRKSVFNGESINSDNSYLFSLSTRMRTQKKKAMLRAKQPKPPSPRRAWINIKPGFYVSPLRFGKPLNLETSTPARPCGAAVPSALMDISGIHNGVEELATNAVESHGQIQEKPINSSANQPANSHESAEKPIFVATRRRPRLVKGHKLTFSAEEQEKENLQDNDDNENANDLMSIISIASQDISNMVESKQCKYEEKTHIEMQKLLRIDDDSVVDLSDTQNINEDTEKWTNENCRTIDSFEILQQNSSTASVSDCGSKLVHRIYKIETIAEEQEAIDTISVSSTSTGHTSISTTISTTSASNMTTSLVTANQPKESIKPKVGFDATNSIHELSSMSEAHVSSQKIVIKGGKWRRTIFEMRKNKLTQSPKRMSQRRSERNSQKSKRPSQSNALRRKSVFVKDIPDRKTINILLPRKSQQLVTVLDESDDESICSSDCIPKATPINVLAKLRSNRLQPIADSVDLKHYRKSAFDRNTGSQLSLCDSSSIESVVNELENSTASLHIGFNPDELKSQLLKRCGQTDVLPFDEIYSTSILKKCQKIGEGVFGEVFLNETSARCSYVLKIIPIEGADEINGAQQKRFDEILQEVIISQELSALRHCERNRSAGFVEVLNVRLVEGRYPSHLLDLWDDFDTRIGSENDRPDAFGDDQLYVVFELANCGSDLEAHVFKNAEQSFSAFKQVAISLAVAESQFQFEHRDLHWGNVLVVPTTETSLTFVLNGKSIEIRTHGIKATIIDYTLSRLVFKNCCLFQDLAADPELFEATGDYQYDIYRLMRTHTNNYWEVFEPYTNVLWLHYTIDKMIDGVNYTAKRGAKHRQFIEKMIKLRDELEEYRSATDYIEANH